MSNVCRLWNQLAGRPKITWWRLYLWVSCHTENLWMSRQLCLISIIINSFLARKIKRYTYHQYICIGFLRAILISICQLFYMMESFALCLQWRRPPLITDIAVPVEPGFQSTEKQIQKEREKGVLQAIFFTKEM